MSLNVLRKNDPEFAKQMAQVLIDTILLQAGVMVKTGDVQKRVIDMIGNTLQMKLSTTTPKLEDRKSKEEPQKSVPENSKIDKEKPKASIQEAKAKSTSNYTINDKGEIVI